MRFKTKLSIDLSALKENAEQLRRILPNNQILFMVKANGYGHGMVPIVRYASTELGIKEFGCATLGEALTLRKELRDIDFDVYVFSDLELDSENGLRHYLDHRIIPVISHRKRLEDILADKDCQYLPLCLKVDTGMNRLGIRPEEIRDVMLMLKQRQRLKIHHLLSHFACSSQAIEIPGKVSRTQKQYEKFQEIKQMFLAEGFTLERTSMANSGAIEQGFALAETHVRPGLLLYGPSSLIPQMREQSKWQGKNISSLQTHIINLYQVKKGEPIGYGAFPAPASGLMAYLALGYGDGITNFYRGMKIYHRGLEGVCIGRISMDMMAVLFPEKAEKILNLDETVYLWDRDPQTVYRLADHISSIPYEIFCGLSERIPRVYQS